MKVKPKNKLKLLKVSVGQYLTEDIRFLIVKDDKGWHWLISEGNKWVEKDRRRYKTKAWAERCVEAESYQQNDELQLWEG